jgi:hypothetical protein
MLTLTEALAAIAPALKPTPYFDNVNVLLNGNTIQAYNGQLYTSAKLDHDHGHVALNAERLKGIWTEDCAMSIAEQYTTIIKGKSRYRLLMQDLNKMVFPNQIPRTGFIIPDALRKAIYLSGKFISTNALHLWSNAVTIMPRGVISTNNQILVRVEYVSNIQNLTLPKWAMDALSDGPLPIMSWNDNSILFEYPNGVAIQAQKLEAELPEAFLSLADSLVPATQLIGTAKEDLEEVKRVDGRFVVIKDGHMTVDVDGGEQAVTETSLKGEFKGNVNTLTQAFEVATRVSFEDAPTRLRFSNDELVGIAMGAT